MSEVPQTIRPLPDHVINQIAAGEVIERPASVVKELVENSLDAGAHRIAVDLREGGLQTIRVSDDGCGIPGSDLINAITRHCTSKLNRAEDLAAIGTLGFRGEALASIAAVARVTVTSSINGATTGHRLSVSPGLGHELHPAPHPVGTTIEVSELFFNTPPRRRFLKRPRTEFLLIQQLLRQLAFTRPAHEFELRHDGKRVFHLPPAHGDAANARMAALLGRPFIRHAAAVSSQFDDIRIAGWVGLPGAARSLRDQQYLSVNGRVITDRRLGHALRLAFDDLIPIGRHPCYALAIELPLTQVDVNVHPCKAEVRFAEPRLVHDALYLATARALRSAAEMTAKADADEPAIDQRGAVNEPRFWPGYRGATGSPAQPRHTGSAAATDVRIVAGRWLVSFERDRLRLFDTRPLISELVRDRLSARGIAVRRRPLLLPVELPPGDPVLEQVSELEAFGFEFRSDSRRGALVAVPVLLPDFDGVTFVNALRERGQTSDAIERVAQAVAIAWIPPTQGAALSEVLAEALRRRTRSDCHVELDAEGLARLFARTTPNDDA